jgi:hypothetical protein
MVAPLVKGLASLLLACIVLTGCSESKPQCQQNPPFYLRGTDFDCATQVAPPAGDAAK